MDPRLREALGLKRPGEKWSEYLRREDPLLLAMPGRRAIAIGLMCLGSTFVSLGIYELVFVP